ncbi:MAG: transglutaminase family protein [Streptosporangiaceae bacterium]
MIFLGEPWDFLGASEAIDFEDEAIQVQAARFPDGDVPFAHAAFRFVRDEIAHSIDAGDTVVTWRASDVLARRTGLCYAKSHLYVALLRAAGISAGLAYQQVGSFVHGVAAVELDGRWVRLDPRGDNAEVSVDFAPDEDRLAHPHLPLHPEVRAEPHPVVLAALRSSDDLPTLVLPATLQARTSGG